MLNQAVMNEIVTEIEKLPDVQVTEVLDFVRFLRTRSGSTHPRQYSRRIFDEAKAATLYSEATAEDRQLAEAGLPDYVAALKNEDADAKG